MKASVIIPAYNAERTIASCLESLERQSLKPSEIIVVDDGSRDRTAQIVGQFRGTRLLTQENAGPAAARNLGVENSRGDVIVFLDSDCIASGEWLREMLAPFSEKDIAGVQGMYKTRQGKIIARFIQLEIEKRYEKMSRHRYIDFIGSYAAAYRSEIFKKMNGFDTSFPIASGEDTDLSYRIHEAGYKMVFNPNAIVFHSHPESLWKYLKVKFFRALWRMKLYKKHKRKMVKDAYTSQTVKLQVGLFYLICLESLAAIFEPLLWQYYVIPLTLLLFLSTLPFAVWAFARDRMVGLLSPGIIVLRTMMFGFGMAVGIANHLRRSV